MIIVPAPVRTAAATHALLDGLLVTDAGYFPHAAGHRVERPLGAPTHLLILCLHGRGWARSAGKTVRVEPGGLVWLPAEQPHAYGADNEDPWTIAWAHFRGKEVAAWQKELGWAARSPIGEIDLGTERTGTLGLDKVYAILEAGYSMQHLLGASTALRAVFCAALDLAKSAGAAKTAAERTAAVRENIAADSARPYRLEELATAAGLSIPHFCTLFRRQTGYAPIDFLIRQRIRRACRLLDSTPAAVAAIATEVGFDDPYYFSRCFHRVMGHSPRAYRKRIKG